MKALRLAAALWLLGPMLFAAPPASAHIWVGVCGSHDRVPLRVPRPGKEEGAPAACHAAAIMAARKKLRR